MVSFSIELETIHAFEVIKFKVPEEGRQAESLKVECYFIHIIIFLFIEIFDILPKCFQSRLPKIRFK